LFETLMGTVQPSSAFLVALPRCRRWGDVLHNEFDGVNMAVNVHRR